MRGPTGNEPNLTNAAYATLRGELLACRLRPNEKLNIAALSAQLGVSLGAVREALSRLTSEGLVTAETNRGFRVAGVSESDLLDLTSTRIELETACLRRAIRAGGVEWETQVVAAHHRLSRTPEREAGDLERVNEEWAVAHKEFHAALIAACESPWRMRLRDFLFDQTERYRRLSVLAPQQERDLPAEHRALMEATLARAEDTAVALLTAHLDATASRVRALVEGESTGPAAKLPLAG
ncbi:MULTISPECIES: FCD domain-containing protein [unclassified Beijerinckia]|uniref:GntR family transcriptional regulator n=1 Tax=unclassified Beijerinckia TaxID=2638183 RepID=UPI000898D2A5|nr:MULTISPECIES: FCD domain-containing protein [unclassified Beijerinckia]MDH7796921.1 DNA-binding GntR family transcriptional regulator [Beijerinckia sp. GAS462]SEC65218.1 transcriptional regulator, GntR family [Beijerinckia sp. 28-YEA-48]